MNKQNQCIIISFLICNFFIAISASQKLERTVKFPPRKILIDRLTKATSAHFVEYSKLVDTLLDGPKYALGVANAVELALVDYQEYCDSTMSRSRSIATHMIMQDLKARIYEKVLEEDPAALAELQDKGLYKPTQITDQPTQQPAPAQPRRVVSLPFEGVLFDLGYATPANPCPAAQPANPQHQANTAASSSPISAHRHNTPAPSDAVAQAMRNVQERLAALQAEAQREAAENSRAHEAFCQRVTADNLASQTATLVSAIVGNSRLLPHGSSGSSSSRGYSGNNSAGRDASDRAGLGDGGFSGGSSRSGGSSGGSRSSGSDREWSCRDTGDRFCVGNSRAVDKACGGNGMEMGSW